MEQTGKLKVVIHLSGGQARIGVQEEGTDPVMVTLQASSLEVALASVPGLLERVRVSWAQSPRNPAYQGPPAPPPPPTPVPTPQPQRAAETPQPRFF